MLKDMEETNKSVQRLGLSFWKEKREIRNVYKIANDQKGIDLKTKTHFLSRFYDVRTKR